MTTSIARRTLAALIVVTACGNIDEPNFGGASIDGLQTNPNISAIVSASQGLLTTWRSTGTSHANTLTKYGFEIWQIRASNPPSLTQIVTFPQTGGFWGYGGVKNIGVLLKAVDVVPGMTDAAREGVRGWAKTILAVQLEDIAQAHDTFGIVLDLPANPLTDIPPIESKGTV